MYLIFIVILALISAYTQFYTLSWLVSHVFAFHLYVTVISSSLAQVFPSGSIKFCFILSVGDYLLLLLLFLQRYKHTNIKKKHSLIFRLQGKTMRRKRVKLWNQYICIFIYSYYMCVCSHRLVFSIPLLFPGVSLSDQCSLSPQQLTVTFLPARAHTRAGLERTQRGRLILCISWSHSCNLRFPRRFWAAVQRWAETLSFFTREWSEAMWRSLPIYQQPVCGCIFNLFWIVLMGFVSFIIIHVLILFLPQTCCLSSSDPNT